MDISIALCTWNRAKTLDRTLQRLGQLRVPEGLSWEVLVVDNNCTDDTPRVVESHADRLPVRRLVEKEQGVSNARNCALRSAQGELLLFTDDDILVAEDWLTAYLAAAHRWPEAGFFGGVIAPLYESEPPAWFRANESVLSVYVGEAHDLGSSERFLTAQEWPWGGNMAFRRIAYESERFQPNLGRRGNERVAGGELAFCRGLVNRGFQGVWVPNAKVEHLVGAERLTLSFVRRNFVAQGVTDVRLSSETKNVAMLFGVPRWMILATVRAHVKYLWQRTTRNPAWFSTFVAAAHDRGALTEYWRNRRVE